MAWCLEVSGDWSLYRCVSLLCPLHGWLKLGHSHVGSCGRARNCWILVIRIQLVRGSNFTFETVMVSHLSFRSGSLVHIVALNFYLEKWRSKRCCCNVFGRRLLLYFRPSGFICHVIALVNVDRYDLDLTLIHDGQWKLLRCALLVKQLLLLIHL